MKTSGSVRLLLRRYLYETNTWESHFGLNEGEFLPRNSLFAQSNTYTVAKMNIHPIPYYVREINLHSYREGGA